MALALSWAQDDSTRVDVDTTLIAHNAQVIMADTAKINNIIRHITDQDKRKSFTPDPIRAMWLGIAFPGGGQIYNRKFWKLPVFYGGFLGCMYALTWNNMMLRDYSQAYLDIMDDDPTTASYEEMLPLGYSIEGKEERFQTIFKNKKDRFRKYRDLSVFAFIGVYGLSIIDAYVDAELSTFDISRDLSLNLAPAVIDLPERRHAYGLSAALNF